jgi:hypothetical protein
VKYQCNSLKVYYLKDLKGKDVSQGINKLTGFKANKKAENLKVNGYH